VAVLDEPAWSAGDSPLEDRRLTLLERWGLADRAHRCRSTMVIRRPGRGRPGRSARAARAAGGRAGAGGPLSADPAEGGARGR
jgi:hypothetical protein